MADTEEKIAFIGEDKLSDLLNDFGNQFENMGKQLDGLEAVAAKAAATIAGDMKDAGQSTEEAGQSAESAGGMFQNLGSTLMDVAKNAVSVAAGMMGLKAATSVLGALQAGFDEFVSDEVVMTRLGAAVKASGGDWDALKESAIGVGDSFAKMSVSDDAVWSGLQRLTEITGSYQKALSLLPMASDMAAAKGMDLSTAAQLVGRAAQGSTTMLARYGIVLKEGATATEALTAIQQKFAGQTEAMANTVQGGLTRVGMMFREVGGAALEAFGPALVVGLSAIANGFSAMIPIMQQFGQNIVTNLQAAWQKIAPIAQSAWAAVQSVVRTALNAILSVAQAIGGQMATWWTQNHQMILQITQTVLAAIAGFWQTHGQQILALVQAAWTVISTVIKTALSLVMGIIRVILQAITGDWAGAHETIKNITTGAWVAIRMVIATALSAIFGIFDTVWKDIVNVVGWAAEQIHESVIGRVLESMTEFVRGLVERIQTVIAAFHLENSAIGQSVNGIIAKLNEKKVAVKDMADRGVAALGREVNAVRTWAEQYRGAASVVLDAMGAVERGPRGGNLNPPATLPALPVLPALPDFTAFDWGAPGAGGAGEATKAVEKRAEEVVADIAKTIEAMIKSILEIKTTLSQKLPDIPGDVIGKWLDDLLSMTQQVGAWAAGKGGAFGEFIKWFNSDLLPDLKSWGEIVGSMNTLFSGIKSIHETGSEKLAEMRTSVADFFNALGGLFDDVNTYMGRVQGGGLVSISEPFQALDAQVVEWIESLKVGAEALAGTLTSARAVIDALVDKLPATDKMGTSIGEIFSRIAGIFDAVREYTKGMAFGGGLISAPADIVAPLSEGLVAWLTSLQTSLEPLKAVLESARGIFDSLVEPLKAMGMSVGAMFEALRGIMDEVQAYVGSAEGKEFADVAVVFEGDTGIGATLTRWTKSLEPIKGILELTRGITELLVPEVEQTKATIEVLFQKLLDLVTEVKGAVEGKVGTAIQSMLDTWNGPKGIAVQLKAWAEALTPLQTLLSVIKGILDMTANRVEAVEMSVKNLFDNLFMVLQEVTTQVTERVNNNEWYDAIDAFASIEEPLADMEAVIGKLKPFIDAVAAICDVTGKRWPSFRLNMEQFLNQMLEAIVVVTDWFRKNSGMGLGTKSPGGAKKRAEGGKIGAALDGFDAIVVQWLQPLTNALLTISDAMNSMMTSATPLGSEAEGVRNSIKQMLDNLGYLSTLMTDWLADNETGFADLCTRFTTAVVGALQILATGTTIIDPATGKPMEAGGLESGLLMELINQITDLIEQVKVPFVELYSWLLGPYRSMLGSISLASSAQRIAYSFINKILSMLGEFYDAGYQAGLSYVQGFNDALGLASPSKVMIAAAKNIVNSFVMQAKSDADKMYQAGKALGGAVEEGVRDALGMHSLSDVGINMGQNFATSFNQGAAWQPSMGHPGLGWTGGGIPITGSREPTAAERYRHVPGVDTARSQWEQEKLTSLTTNITFAGAVSIRSDKDIEEIANQVSRKLASRFSSMNRWGAKV